MNPQESDGQPRMVNERFWLEWAAKFVETTLTEMDDGAARVANAMAWFWSAYTAVVIAATSIGTAWTFNGAQQALVAAPAVLLFLAYAVATWAALPIQSDFDPRQPDDIKRSYDRIVRSKQIRLVASMAIGIFAVIIVGAAIVGAFARPNPTERGLRIESNPTGNAIIVSGTIEPSSTAVIEVTRVGMEPLRSIATSNTSGTIQFDTPIAPGSEFDVLVSWTAEGYEFSTGKGFSGD